MNDKQREFANYMFQSIYGTLTDKYGDSYVKLYQYQTENLIRNMRSDLNIILKVFGEIYVDDISKVFAIRFWDTDTLINCNIDDIAYKFDALYGESIGDRPTFG